jgi:hypothetical protein
MSDHTATLNSAVWNRKNEEYADAVATTAWSETEITWGLFAKAERELNILGAVAGLDVIELGCGTAYFSSWLARRGARPVGRRREFCAAGHRRPLSACERRRLGNTPRVCSRQ